MLRKKKIWIALCFLCAVFIMGLLLKSSSQTYHEQSLVPFMDKILAGKPLEGLLSHVSFVYANEEVSIANLGYSKFLEFFIRKGAHFFTYFVMGASLFAGVRGLFGKNWSAFLVALPVPLLFAISDEIHQKFTGGRTPLVQDVVLDFTGACIGTLVCFWLLNVLRKRRIEKLG
ncbi:VanZ family protein [Listeria floridensis FSL S10-1187]|uniref:VanZ family protein n=1 Tax=Listeria floridensis FSL S10-1187 TaxID=1265817 RepID=A0ABN0RH76_9LIST|nr:VanZ family protein [Listeria floridensis]EUJ33196.1 VanZ family protein [Listeria floridensis FSL S10-1187]